MFLQGHLQTYFEALYSLGVIDPVLELDWTKEMENLPDHLEELQQVMVVANRYQDDPDQLKAELEKFSNRSLQFFAMEVAREFAEFHARKIVH